MEINIDALGCAKLGRELPNLTDREAILDFLLNDDVMNERFDKNEAFPRYLQHLWEVIRRRSQILTRTYLQAQGDELWWWGRHIPLTVQKLSSYWDAIQREKPEEQEVALQILREDPVFAWYAMSFDEIEDLQSIIEYVVYVALNLTDDMLWGIVKFVLLDIALVFRNQGETMPPWQPGKERLATVKKVYLENVDEIRSRDWLTMLTYDIEETSRKESSLEIAKPKYEGARQLFEKNRYPERETGAS